MLTLTGALLLEYEGLEAQLRATNARLRNAITNLHATIENNINDENVRQGRDSADDGRGERPTGIPGP